MLLIVVGNESVARIHKTFAKASRVIDFDLSYYFESGITEVAERHAEREADHWQQTAVGDGSIHPRR